MVILILVALAAAAVMAWSYDARFFARMGARDIVHGRLPAARHLASDALNPELAGTLGADFNGIADPAEALAAVEMEAAGVLSARPDPKVVAGHYRRLAERFPKDPAIRYRRGAHSLTCLQQKARDVLSARSTAADAAALARGYALEEAAFAREEFAAAAALDGDNSLYYYETAYSYLVFGNIDEALIWCEKGRGAKGFNAYDGAVIAGAARLVTKSGIPPLEGLAATYAISQFSPSYMGARMEALVSGLLSRGVMDRLNLKEGRAIQYVRNFADVSEKLFQTADVIRQSQASFVTAGLAWRRIESEAELTSEGDLLAAARRHIAEASYRYVLVGYQRAGLGLMPQQTIVELGTPVDLDLRLSGPMRGVARIFLIAALALAAMSAAGWALARKRAALRPVAAALTVGLVFAFAAYAAAFFAMHKERSRVADSLERRLQVICGTPEYLRMYGQPSSPADYRTDVAKSMLFSFDYTAQAGRVLAYVGTRDCFDTLVESLASPSLPRHADIVYVLEDATGRDFGYRPGGSRSANNEALGAWDTWWRSERYAFPEAPSGPAF